eukprot:358796-Chlamydomonas_euryale.AAC.10
MAGGIEVKRGGIAKSGMSNQTATYMHGKGSQGGMSTVESKDTKNGLRILAEQRQGRKISPEADNVLSIMSAFMV